MFALPAVNSRIASSYSASCSRTRQCDAWAQHLRQSDSLAAPCASSSGAGARQQQQQHRAGRRRCRAQAVSGDLALDRDLDREQSWQQRQPSVPAGDGAATAASTSGSAAAAAAAAAPVVSSSGRVAEAPRRMQAPRRKVGVLLLNLGGPENLEDVRPFLYNLFADPDIIRLPSGLRFLQPLLASIISSLRAPKSTEGYQAIGGGSPLRRITEDQAAALAGRLRAKGLEGAEVYVAMRYWHPYTEEALQHVVRDGVTQLVILPLYPQFSISTSGSSLRLLEQLFKVDPVLRNMSHTVIPSWYQRRGYVSAMVDLIEQEMGGFRDPTSAHIFFSAHGVPKSYVTEAGDPYKEEMEECVDLIMQELRRRGRNNVHTLAYQSRVGPVEWLQPYTDDTIRSLGAQGVRCLLAVPISFVSEHIETLEEMDMEYRELALESGMQEWRRVPALNTNAAFIDDLAQAVVEALPYVGQMAGAGPASDSLVPIGELETLLDAYDRDRRTLPAPVGPWEWGFTKSAETWNGRIAMVAIIVILLLELSTGQGVLNSMMVID